MKKNDNFVAQMMRVPLKAAQGAALQSLKARKDYCHRLALEGSPCWAESHPHQVVADIFENLTVEKFAELIAETYSPRPGPRDFLESLNRLGITELIKLSETAHEAVTHSAGMVAVFRNRILRGEGSAIDKSLVENMALYQAQLAKYVAEHAMILDTILDRKKITRPNQS